MSCLIYSKNSSLPTQINVFSFGCLTWFASICDPSTIYMIFSIPQRLENYFRSFLFFSFIFIIEIRGGDISPLIPKYPFSRYPINIGSNSLQRHQTFKEFSNVEYKPKQSKLSQDFLRIYQPIFAIFFQLFTTFADRIQITLLSSQLLKGIYVIQHLVKDLFLQSFNDWQVSFCAFSGKNFQKIIFLSIYASKFQQIETCSFKPPPLAKAHPLISQTYELASDLKMSSPQMGKLNFCTILLQQSLSQAVSSTSCLNSEFLQSFSTSTMGLRLLSANINSPTVYTLISNTLAPMNYQQMQF